MTPEQRFSPRYAIRVTALAVTYLLMILGSVWVGEFLAIRFEGLAPYWLRISLYSAFMLAGLAMYWYILGPGWQRRQDSDLSHERP